MNTPLRNLRFMQRRHRMSGFDADYLLKLSPENLAWLEAFARRYYNGEGEDDLERRKEANHRRYMAKSADAMGVSKGFTVSDCSGGIDDLNPERLLILSESPINPPRRLRSKKRGSNEADKKET